MQIYLVRHGETDWNLHKRVMGQSDIPLNQNGIQQAKQLAEKLKNKQLDYIFSSNLQRAIQTAEIIKDSRQIQVIQSPLLAERFFGKFEGISHEELNTTFAKELDELMLLNVEKRNNFRFHEEIEPNISLWERFNKFIGQLESYNENANILIVSHGGLLQAVLQNVDLTDKFVDHKAKLNNTCIITLEYKNQAFEIIEYEGIELR